MLDLVCEVILTEINKGSSIRHMCKVLGKKGVESGFRRISYLEDMGYVTPPSRPGGTDRCLSQLGIDYLKAQGYLK